MPSGAARFDTQRMADVLRVVLVIAALVLAVVRPLPTMLLASAAVALAIRLLGLPRGFDLAAVLAMAVTGVSSAAGLYDTFGLYDRLVHLTVIGLLAPTAAQGLQQRGLLPPADAARHRLGAAVVLAVAVGLAIAAWWEVFEWSADRWVGATLAHGADDTIGDLVAGALGATIGGTVEGRVARRG